MKKVCTLIDEFNEIKMPEPGKLCYFIISF
jgi:hypothetical protein